MSDEAKAQHYVVYDGVRVHVIEADALRWDERSIQLVCGGFDGEVVAEFITFAWWRSYDTREQATLAAQQAHEPLECIVGAP